MIEKFIQVGFKKLSKNHPTYRLFVIGNVELEAYTYQNKNNIYYVLFVNNYISIQKQTFTLLRYNHSNINDDNHTILDRGNLDELSVTFNEHFTSDLRDSKLNSIIKPKNKFTRIFLYIKNLFNRNDNR